MTTSNDKTTEGAESADSAWDDLASQIKEGVESGPAAPMTESDWKEVEAEIRNPWSESRPRS